MIMLVVRRKTILEIAAEVNLISVAAYLKFPSDGFVVKLQVDVA